MSKQLTALLLKKKMDKTKNSKDFLIKCLKNQGYVKEDIEIKLVEKTLY